jgi:hypothetical protein
MEDGWPLSVLGGGAASLVWRRLEVGHGFKKRNLVYMYIGKVCFKRVWFFFRSGQERRPKFTDVAEAAGWGELQRGASDWWVV